MVCFLYFYVILTISLYSFIQFSALKCIMHVFVSWAKIEKLSLVWMLQSAHFSQPPDISAS